LGLYTPINAGKNHEIIITLNEWKNGQDEIKKAFAEQALRHAKKRREEHWHSDD
jgi:hypothetical protein